MSLTRKIIFGLLAAIILLTGSVYLYLFVLGGLESQVNRRLAQLIGPEIPVDVKVGEIRGDLVSNINLINIVISAQIDGASHSVIRVDSLKAAYQLSDLMRSDFTFTDVEILGPEIMMIKNASGQWSIPGITGRQGESTELPELPSINIDALVLTGGKLILVESGDTTVIDNCSLIASLQADNQIQSIDIRQISLASEDKLYAIESASAKVTIQNDNVVVQDGFIHHGATRVRFDGQVEMARLSGWLNLNIDNLDMGEVSRLAGVKLSGNVDLIGRVELADKELSGEVNLGGRFFNIDLENLSLVFDYLGGQLNFESIYGSVMGGCAIDGEGAIDFTDKPEQYWLDATVKNFNLSHIAKGRFESDLNGTISLRGESFKKSTLLLNFDLDLDESSFHEYNFHGARGALMVTTDSVRFADSFYISYFENEFLLAGKIEYSDSVDLTLSGELPDLKRYEKKLFLEQPAGRATVRATLTGLTASPDLKGVFESDSLWLYGLYADSAVAVFDIKRMFTGQQGTVDASFYNGKAWALPYDSLYVHLSPDSNLLGIDSAAISTQVASIWSKGYLHHGVYPRKVALDTLGIVFFDQVFFNVGRINIEIDSSGFDFKKATIAKTDARLSVDGRVNYDETMSLKMEAENVRVAPWLSLFEDTPQLDAALSAMIDLRGSFEQPQFEFAGSLDELTDTDTSGTGTVLLLGDLVARASYDSGRLVIDTVQLFTPGGIHSASGYLHADLAFVDDNRDRFPDRPFDIHFDARDERFDLIMKLLPSVDSMAGEFTADVYLSGTPSDPHLEGSAFIKNARLLHSDLVDPIFSDSAGVTMKNDQIILDSLSVYTVINKKRSYASVDGVITVKSLDNLHYNLDIDIPEVTPVRYSLEDIEGELSGTIHVDGDTPPKVTGELVVTSLDYEVPFADTEEGSPLMLALTGADTWDLELDIEVPSRFRIKNPDIDAEFSGNLTLIREDGVSRFMGELEVIRGKAFLFDKTFRLEPGSRVSFQGNEIINPNLDIIAHTKILGIPQQSSSGTSREQMELSVHIGGTLDVPEIDPVEGSQFAKEDIIPLLVANYYSADTMQTESALAERITALATSQITQRTSVSFGSSTLSIDEIDPAYYGQLDWSRASVTTGFYHRSFYAYGRHTPGQGEVFQEFGAEYRITQHLLLEGQRSEQDEFRLNLKLHLEF